MLSVSNMSAHRTLEVAQQCLPTQLRPQPVQSVIIRGSSSLSLATYNSNYNQTCNNGLDCDLRPAAARICCSAWICSRRSGLPMSELHCRSAGGVPQNPTILSGDREGAGMWLLSGVRQAGRGALRRLHAEVLQRTEVLPQRRGRTAFAAAHTGHGPLWTENGAGYIFLQPWWAGDKWQVTVA